MPPEQFWRGSSIGQLHAFLVERIPGAQGLLAPLLPQFRLAAAADHCLTAAYQGKCPGVEPRELRAWRIRTRAAHQNLPEQEIVRRIDASIEALKALPTRRIGAVPVARAGDKAALIPYSPSPAAMARRRSPGAGTAGTWRKTGARASRRRAAAGSRTCTATQREGSPAPTCRSHRRNRRRGPGLIVERPAPCTLRVNHLPGAIDRDLDLHRHIRGARPDAVNRITQTGSAPWP